MLNVVGGKFREPLLKGKLSTVDLNVKITCFVKTKNVFSVLNAFDIN
jgi:hypothetical protein